jgi:multidrug efflux pump subunit AcrA (membrane-fusion protein)
MSLIALPTSASNKRKWIFPLAAGLGAAIIALFIYWVFSTATAPGRDDRADGVFYSVVPIDLEVKIAKDGELQAVNNIDIYCEVEGQTTIQQIVKEGTTVKKGDTLVVLDSSAIKQKFEDTTLELQKAEADLTTAKEMKEIQESQNAANLEGAEVELSLKKLELEQYVEGTYPQDVSNARTELEMARITLKNKEEDLAQTKNLFTKGFVTAADVKKSELEVTTGRNGVTKAETALKVLTGYTHEMDLASKKNAVAQADQKLIRTQRENTSNLAQKVADVQAKTQALTLHTRRLERYKQQLEACTIKSPGDGMVLYGSSNDRNAASQITEGAQVRERQLLMRLPDTSSMKAIIRVQESAVPKLQLGQRASVKIVGVPQPVGAALSKISVLADNNQRWWNPDLKEYPVELTLDQTPANLKPGVGAQTEVFVSHLEGVLAVPMSTIYSVGRESYVFVRQGSETRPQKIEIGQSNETHAQIAKGLSGGEQVLILQMGQGRDLLEKAGIKVDTSTRPNRNGDGPPNGAPPSPGSGMSVGDGNPNPSPAGNGSSPGEGRRGRRQRSE